HIPNSIFLSPEGHFTDNYADQAPYFNTWKDIVIPGRVDSRKVALMDAAKPQSERRMLGIFMGTHQGKDPRKQLLALSAANPKQIRAECERNPRYAEYMGETQFCFAPRGQSSWTLRFFESFFAGCIPLILADNIELPFQDFIDYSKISIKWPMNRIDNSLIEYLHGVHSLFVSAPLARADAFRHLALNISTYAATPSLSATSLPAWDDICANHSVGSPCRSLGSDAREAPCQGAWEATVTWAVMQGRRRVRVPLEVREAMVRRGQAIRCLFVYNADVTKCNAFAGILMELESRKRRFQQSREVFWLHDGVTVDRALQPLDKWKGLFPSTRLYLNEPTAPCNPTCHEGGPNVCKSSEKGITCKGLKADAPKCG
ncbi:hypothetical protein CYMTET_46175, partial [Cymbomonas tetramitiformis]